MKRKKLYYLLITFVISICLVILTLEFTSIVVDDMLLIFFVYFMLTSSVMVSILAVIRNKKSKAYRYELLTTTDALIAVLSFIFALLGTPLIKPVAYIIFIFTFIMFPFFGVVWNEYEKKEMETKL